MMFNYGIEDLDLHKVMELMKGNMEGSIQKAVPQIQRSRTAVEQMKQFEKAIYGINTGFGPLCDTRISPSQTDQLQENLLLSHAVGVGAPIAKELSKLMMICKVHALSQGYSGVRTELIEMLLQMLNHDLIPVVPEQGSVGASGDLAPLSHLFLPLLGHGYLWAEQQKVSASELLNTHRLQPIRLKSKEGLALINGTQFILAHAIMGLDRMSYLMDLADVAGAMSLEGLQGSAAPFRQDIHHIRPFAGTIEVARRMRNIASRIREYGSTCQLYPGSRSILYSVHTSGSWGFQKYDKSSGSACRNRNEFGYG